MEFEKPSFPLELYTRNRQFIGLLEPLGALLDDINDPEKGDFYLTQASFTPYDPASTMGTIGVPEVVVRKNNTLFFRFTDTSAYDKFRLLARTIQVVVYTPIAALKGEFHVGAEQRLRDMFDTMRGNFQAMTDVTLFPFISSQVALPREIDMLFVNTKNIQFYYPVQE